MSFNTGKYTKASGGTHAGVDERVENAVSGSREGSEEEWAGMWGTKESISKSLKWLEICENDLGRVRTRSPRVLETVANASDLILSATTHGPYIAFGFVDDSDSGAEEPRFGGACPSNVSDTGHKPVHHHVRGDCSGSTRHCEILAWLAYTTNRSRMKS
ncbi:hypothetical protein GYMLUDRAFT_608107 [Collybiopsis luxurians FD-317 M1]|uniref:Uncharacterized protein n=1 Tax=Collybiopsis luxurians FD-317 M1 TaxID=944289 RepID=A0A0D0B9T2_9AGAR|nr:hypothetical protein GYMLUDRAFT_608107 [Collybiopsis luxurians FD-317 M1]